MKSHLSFLDSGSTVKPVVNFPLDGHPIPTPDLKRCADNCKHNKRAWAFRWREARAFGQRDGMAVAIKRAVLWRDTAQMLCRHLSEKAIS